ncbi:MAG: chromate efflux transporter [Acidimicrobiia bacterium]
MPPRTRLRDLAGLFLKLGTIGFGGPAAHIAMMRDEVVRRRGWEDDDEFLDLVGATNLIPGPNSTELAIHLGARRAGWRGLVVAGLSFIVPAFVIVLALAWLYDRYGTDPAAVDLRYGILPVIVAVIAQALWVLGRTAVKGPVLGVVACATAGLYLADVNELLLLAAGGVIATVWANRHRLRGQTTALLPWAAALPLVVGAPVAANPALGRVFLVFLKIGAVLYGSGYVLVAFLERDVVDTYHWITTEQLLDAVAVGQITPGPVFTTATFVGYQIDGFAGAAVATVAIFLPSFVFVALLTSVVPWMRRSPWAGAALDGVNAASLGLMAGVTVLLLDDAFPDVLAVAIGLAAIFVLLRWRVNTASLVGAGALVGLARLAVG